MYDTSSKIYENYFKQEIAIFNKSLGAVEIENL